MTSKKTWIAWCMSIGLLALLSAGIVLFYLREHKYAQIIAHEMVIRAQPASQFIIKDQFIILAPKVPKDFKSILDNLDLEVTMPLLNWVLVSKKGHNISSVVALDSEEAEQDRLILRSLLEHSHILDAQHNYILENTLVPINNNFKDEWHLLNLNMPAAWNITQGNPSHIIAIIDDFLLDNYFTFAERFAPCQSRVSLMRPFPELSSELSTSSIPHGEIMLLALGACINEKPYSSGIDWHAQLLAVQRSSKGQAQSFLAALWASGIDVCQKSSLPCPPSTPALIQAVKPSILVLPFTNNAPDLLQFSADMVRAIKEQNILIVASAGNNNQDASSFFPGATPPVINVAALNHHGERASFSNWGSSVDILAPGDAIPFYFPSGKKYAQGTSIAAAYAAGALSLMRTQRPTLTQSQARYLLRSSATPLSCEAYCGHDQSCQEICCPENLNQCGAQALNVYKAVRQSQNNIIPSLVLTVDNNYVVLFRNFAAPEKILVRNEGDMAGEVEVLVFDDNLDIRPRSFNLQSRNNSDSHTIYISFKREPFSRTNHKIRLLAKVKGKIVDWEDVYIEYIPKKYADQ